MHPRSFLKLLLAIILVVSLSIVDQAAHTYLIAPPVDLLPRLDFSSL